MSHFNPTHAKKVVNSETITKIVTPIITTEVSYVRTTPIPETIGGADAGITFSGTLADALDILFYPYQEPTFSSFSFSQTSPLEVGDTIAAGSKTFLWTTTNPANIQTSSIAIDDLTIPLALASGLADDGSEAITIAAVTHITSATHTWRILGTDTELTVFTRNFSVLWYWRVTYGESLAETLDSAAILALRVTALAATINGTKAFLGGGYKFICYPTTFGLKTSFKDTATNLDVAMIPAATVAVTNSFGIIQNYYVHRTLNILGGAINIAVS